MKCVKCGKELSTEAKFCPGCGAMLTAEPEKKSHYDCVGEKTGDRLHSTNAISSANAPDKNKKGETERRGKEEKLEKSGKAFTLFVAMAVISLIFICAAVSLFVLAYHTKNYMNYVDNNLVPMMMIGGLILFISGIFGTIVGISGTYKVNKKYELDI